ncbi:MAG: cytidylate kinase-like family protein [Deltaproteobacteria bacterium]|nr:cytidylate kinase-like family protein [Deltaproteobacteria bacterium]
MPIVLISSSPHGSGRELAQNLAEKTGWTLYSRDQVVEKAYETGIRLSRLETSIIKSPVIRENLARERDLYLALVAKTICETATDGNLIYHGRAGHLIAPGIPGVLRVGLGSTLEMRIDRVMKQLNLPQEKAREYLEKLDEDIEKWIRYIHRETSRNALAYDLFLNLQHMTLENASTILYETAILKDFRLTLEGRNKLDDKCLAANAKIHLARNPETSGMDLGIRAVNGAVTVTYMPRQEVSAASISKALRGLKGCRENICTMAETNILWIQESFDPKGENFDQVTQLAKRWGAAIELLRLDSEGKEIFLNHGLENSQSGPRSSQMDTGGVEDDDIDTGYEDKGLSETVEELVAIGRSAGGFSISGAAREVIDAVKDNNNYSLIILGNLFLSKGHETSTRLTRELGLELKEKLKAPVITSGELHSRFLFGKKQAFKLLGYVLATFLIYWLVFSFQDPILNILGGELHSKFKWAASIGIALFVPVVAYVYSTVTGLVLKIVDID